MNSKQRAGEFAANLIQNDMIVALGSGTTSAAFVIALGQRVQQGLHIQCVSSSDEITKLAKQHGLSLISLEKATHIDIAIDGVDEIDEHFNAIKGGGGALLREKILANAANKVYWIMDKSKCVKKLGKFPFPVEIARFGYLQTINLLQKYHPILRKKNDTIFISDNGNYIVDLQLNTSINYNNVIADLNQIPGVLSHGYFPKMCDGIIVADDRKVIFINSVDNHK